MLYLRQSTASQSVVIGPFVDSTDGNTAETALTIDAADIRLSKNGANIVGKNSGGGTHDELGYYTITLDATDTDTVGRLQIMVHESGALPVYHEFQVLEEAIFDAMFAGSANAWSGAAGSSVVSGLASGSITATVVATGAIDADAIADNAIDAGAIASNALALSKFATDARNAFGFTTTGTLSGTHSDTTADLGASAPSSDITGQTLYFSDHDISRIVTAYNTGTGVATFDSIGVTLANGNTWYRYPTAPSSGGSAPSAATVAAAVWDASQASHTTAGSFGELATEIAAILVDTGTTLQGELDGIQADTEDIQSRLPASLNNGCIPADVQRFNDVEVVGAGTEGDKWRA